MLFGRQRISAHEAEELESVCAGFLSQLLQETDFGQVWRFNKMKYQLSGDDSIPANIVTEMQESIASDMVAYVNQELKGSLVKENYYVCKEVILSRTKKLHKYLSSREYQIGDEIYEAAGSIYIALRVLYLSILFEDLIETLDRKNENGKYRKVLNDSLGAAAILIKNALGKRMHSEYCEFFPKVYEVVRWKCEGADV